MRPKEPKKYIYSLCEGVRATGSSPWHLRRITEKGAKYGGGIDTGSMCGLIKAPWGWDLHVTITPHHLTHTCPECVELYLQETRKDK